LREVQILTEHGAFIATPFRPHSSLGYGGAALESIIPTDQKPETHDTMAIRLDLCMVVRHLRLNILGTMMLSFSIEWTNLGFFGLKITEMNI
jgi:hypothetical protein